MAASSNAIGVRRKGSTARTDGRPIRPPVFSFESLYRTEQRLLDPMTSQLGIWSYGAQVSQPIFTGGTLRGNLRLAESQHEQALIAYKQAIQQAFGDVSRGD
jgi:outer membrane protein, multidrug efflux system